MKELSFNEAFEVLEDYGFFTYEELLLVTCLEGSRKEVLDNIVNVRFGYRTVEQFMNEWEEMQ